MSYGGQVLWTSLHKWWKRRVWDLCVMLKCMSCPLHGIRAFGHYDLNHGVICVRVRCVSVFVCLFRVS
jgi:hypothetical protein